MSTAIRIPNTPNVLVARILQDLRHLRRVIPEIAYRMQKAVLKVWRKWQSLPWYIRWGTYGALVGLLAFTLLPVVGFTTAGIAAGSLAAGWQSSIGAVSAGGIFSLLQSAGATASLGTAAAFTAVGRATGVLCGAAARGIH